MGEYESIFVCRQSLTEDANTQLIEKFKKIIEKNGGEILKTEQWGKRRLAYEVKKEKKGIYNLIQLKGDGPLISDLERNYMLDDSVIKYMTVRLEHPPVPDPSVSTEGSEENKEK
ncbi:MAG TPA: 30S ribosomal protein S6 [Nitrospiria bacterium]|jgi:small subunit ribosomal protein S6